MKTQLNLAVCALATVMAVSSVGCSSGFRSGTSASSNGAQSTTPPTGEDQVAKAQAAVIEGQKAMLSATTALSTLNTPSGTIDLSV
ncbi:MAG: hypothetical protein ACXVA9_03355, partial [Bdellovibrionales bacterium]